MKRITSKNNKKTLLDRKIIQSYHLIRIKNICCLNNHLNPIRAGFTTGNRYPDTAQSEVPPQARSPWLTVQFTRQRDSQRDRPRGTTPNPRQCPNTHLHPWIPLQDRTFQVLILRNLIPFKFVQKKKNNINNNNNTGNGHSEWFKLFLHDTLI